MMKSIYDFALAGHLQVIDHENFFLINNFARLIQSDPKKINIFESGDFDPCSSFQGLPCWCGGGEGLNAHHWDGKITWCDIEIWFPCENRDHNNCGKFIWVLNLQTEQSHQIQIEEDEQISNKWDDIVLDVEYLSEEICEKQTAIWLHKWVQPLKEIPVKMISYEKRQEMTAIYTENHVGEKRDFYDVLEERVKEYRKQQKE